MTTSSSAASTKITANRGMRLARGAWYPVAAVALGIFIVSIPGYLVLVPRGFDLNAPAVPQQPPLLRSINILAGVFSVATVSLSLYLALLLFRRRPDDRMALYISYFLLAFGVLAAGPSEMIQTFLPGTATLPLQFVTVFITLPMAVFLFALFPNGRFVPGWTRWLGVSSFLVVILMVTVAAIGYALMFIFLFLLLFAQIHRYRHVSTQQQKQQTKWFVYGFGVLLTLLIIVSIPQTWSPALFMDASNPIWEAGSQLLYFISFAIIPVTLTISVMRYRLYDIDILINRTLVYGVLTAIVVTVYVLTVGIASTVFQSSNVLVGILLATGLIVFLFQPLRTTLQRTVDRLMTGNRGIKRRPASWEHIVDGFVEHEDPGPSLLTGRWLHLIRALWVLIAIFVGGLFLSSIPGYFHVLRFGIYSSRFDITHTLVTDTLNFAATLISFFAALLSFTLAWVLYRKRQGEVMATFLSFYLLIYGIGFTSPLEPSYYLWPEFTSEILQVSGVILMGPLTFALFTLFPDGRFIPPWTRWLVILSIPAVLLNYLVGHTFLGGTLPDWVWLGLIYELILYAGAIYAQFFRYRRASSTTQRQQTKWFVYGITLGFSFLALSTPFYVNMLSLPTGSPLPWWAPTSTLLWSLSLLSIPLPLTIGVMRFRLYDIDILINRTLVYGALTVTTMAIYVIAVGYVGNFFQQQDSAFIAFIITGLVALLFQPLRERMQSAVNRLMYGERDNPMSVLVKLGQQLEETVSLQSVLKGIVETIAQALKLPYVAISLRAEKEYKIVEEYGQPASEPIELPLLYQTKSVGQLIISPRSEGESFSAKEVELLRNISRQFGAVAQSVKLATDLQSSRERLAITLEEERRRLRRDLHDGLGASLAALHLQMGGLRRMIRSEPDMAEELVDEFRVQLRQEINEIRRVVYLLRPPALDELGLVAALRTQADRFSEKIIRDGDHARGQGEVDALEIRVEAPDTLPPLQAAVEVAVYRIVQEALTNVVHHAQARMCVVQLVLDGELNVKVSDDGIGIDENHEGGVGLHSMRERAEALGGTFAIESNPEGGTLVWARLPMPKD